MRCESYRKQRISIDGDIKKAAVKDSADGYYTVALSFSQRLGLFVCLFVLLLLNFDGTTIQSQCIFLLEERL